MASAPDVSYDVVIAGSGFGGSICANRLALAGLKVLVLERGPWRDSLPVRAMGIAGRSPFPYGARFATHLLRGICRVAALGRGQPEALPQLAARAIGSPWACGRCGAWPGRRAGPEA